MNSSSLTAFSPRQLRRGIWLILTLWTLAVATSVVWNGRLLHDAMLDAAELDARNGFDRDRLYLLKPDHMTREVHELKAQEDGTLGHITSLKPLRPENAPDAWEAATLQSFEQGRTEAVSREEYQGQPYLRFMKPLITEASCLKCHASQGYHEGDVRGGISVAVPLDPYLALAQARIVRIAGTHAGLWILGVLGIFLGARQMRQRLDQQLQAEEKLRQSEEKFRTVADWTYDMEIWRGPDGRLLYVSPSAERITGYRIEEFLADPKLTLKITHPDDLARVTEHHQKVSQPGNEVCSLDFRILTRSGEERWINHHCQPVYGGDGRWLGQRSGNRDITERKRMEEKLHQLSIAVEQSPASIVITNTAGDIEYVNPKFIALTGYTLAEVLGKNPRVLKSGEKSPEAYRELWETIKAGKEWSGEFHNKKKNGELYWEFASISPIRDPAGRVTHYVAVKEDITARKQTEAERDRLIQDLQNALAHVKSLSGLLPICAGCKKIRDDKGYWSQVESYIQSHSEAKFSHGMCPDCLKKWYPDLVEAGLGELPNEAS
ncbi:MAG: PAS domain S-box protein [Verrucomicrobiia bacterium]|jgi:PAS domain S-box-containing protein